MNWLLDGMPPRNYLCPRNQCMYICMCVCARVFVCVSAIKTINNQTHEMNLN